MIACLSSKNTSMEAAADLQGIMYSMHHGRGRIFNTYMCD